MDVDLEELVKLLKLKDPEGALCNSDHSNYILHLASCGVEKLSREGLHLSDEKASILHQTQNLVFDNYKTFIHTADCTREIYQKFGDVEEHLENLRTELPNLKAGIETFQNSSEDLSASRQSVSLTLSKHTQLLEILEVPQLMETCVRNGYYDNALDILSYVRRLEKKHSDIPIITSIVQDVKGVNRLMLNQLFNQLKYQITLPQCLKVVGILRRLDAFNELELRLKFLQARDSWFTSLIKNIPKEDAYHHVSKVLETSRVHLFDIVTQYRAIFSDDDVRYGIGDSEINEQAIFHGWIQHKVTQFLNILEIDLTRGVGGNIEALLSQCMFFGQSFSRVGADFRSLLIPIFEKAVFTQFEADVRSANLKFDERLCTFSLMDCGQMKSSSFFSATQQQEKASPPLSLMEFSPLAHYMNGIVASFNGLRQCCPLPICSKVVALLKKSLSKVVGALLDLHKLESAGFTDNEEISFKRMVDLFCNAVVPHINTCLQLLFPLQNISKVIGIPVKHLKDEKIAFIDIDAVTDSLKQFLPNEIEPVPSTFEDSSIIAEEHSDDAETPSTVTEEPSDAGKPSVEETSIPSETTNGTAETVN